MTKKCRFILSARQKWQNLFFCTFCPSEMRKKCRFILSYHQKWQKLIFWAFLPSEITKSYFLPLMNIRKPIFFIFLANCITIWIVWILFRMCYNLNPSCRLFTWKVKYLVQFEYKNSFFSTFHHAIHHSLLLTYW